jgi:hypothetical protein
MPTYGLHVLYLLSYPPSVGAVAARAARRCARQRQRRKALSPKSCDAASRQRIRCCSRRRRRQQRYPRRRCRRRRRGQCRVLLPPGSPSVCAERASSTKSRQQSGAPRCTQVTLLALQHRLRRPHRWRWGQSCGRCCVSTNLGEMSPRASALSVVRQVQQRCRRGGAQQRRIAHSATPHSFSNWLARPSPAAARRTPS